MLPAGKGGLQQGIIAMAHRKASFFGVPGALCGFTANTGTTPAVSPSSVRQYEYERPESPTHETSARVGDRPCAVFGERVFETMSVSLRYCQVCEQWRSEGWRWECRRSMCNVCPSPNWSLPESLPGQTFPALRREKKKKNDIKHLRGAWLTC